MRKLRVSVADVHKVLLSVSKIMDANNRIVFDNDWSYIEDKVSKEKTTIWRKKDVFIVNLKVHKPNKVKINESSNRRQGQHP